MAFRFSEPGLLPMSYHKIIAWLKENRGPQSHYKWDDDQCEWTTHNSRASSWRDPDTHFIGLKNETDVSILLLSIGETL